jgi:HPr kinase/phosphorylase
VELVVQLERWDPHREYDRLGLEENRHDILGLKVPLIRMPVAPGRSLAVLVEVAARNQLLRGRGLNAARDLAERLEQTLRDKDVHTDVDAEDDIEHGGHV